MLRSRSSGKSRSVRRNVKQKVSDPAINSTVIATKALDKAWKYLVLASDNVSLAARRDENDQTRKILEQSEAQVRQMVTRINAVRRGLKKLL